MTTREEPPAVDLLPATPLEPATYIVAVSGGLDSRVLLDWLVMTTPGSKLIVAHFDHRLRPGSATVAANVATLAKSSGCQYIESVWSSPVAAEAAARQARYRFLTDCLKQTTAVAIITGHHQDDLIETMALNLARQTGRHGLTSLRTRDRLKRPFLGVTRSEIKKYASDRNLVWDEDPSNQDQGYRRNYYRARLSDRLTASDRQKLVSIYDRLCEVNDQFDAALMTYLRRVSYRQAGRVFPRDWFNQLPEIVAAEVVYWWLRSIVGSYGRRRQIGYIVTNLRTLPPGKRLSLDGTNFVYVTKRSIRFARTVVGSATNSII